MHHLLAFLGYHVELAGWSDEVARMALQLARFLWALFGVHAHAVHTSDLADIPCRKVLIELVCVGEQQIHVRDLQASC